MNVWPVTRYARGHAAFPFLHPKVTLCVGQDVKTLELNNFPVPLAVRVGARKTSTDKTDAANLHNIQRRREKRREDRKREGQTHTTAPPGKDVL